MIMQPQTHLFFMKHMFALHFDLFCFFFNMFTIQYYWYVRAKGTIFPILKALYGA